MIHVEGFLFCILIAAIGSAAGSPAPEAPFSFRADAVTPSDEDILGPSYPNDTEYVAYSASRYHLALSIVDIVILTEWTFEACKYEAASRGGHIFEFDADSGSCNIASLEFKLCRTRQGTIPIYVQPPCLTDGTVYDGTIVEDLKVGVVLRSSLSNPDASYSTFRVFFPSILNFPGYYNSVDSIYKQTIFTEDGALVEVSDDILVDPICYTNSSCGVPFVYPRPDVPANLAWFKQNCGKVVRVTLGQPLYLLSHLGIGCLYFPNSGYGSGTCSVNYRGFSSTGIIITVAFVNFVDGDSCDGFSLNVISYNTQTNTTKTKLCKTSVTEILSPVPRGRIDFSGSAITGRLKYGFIIKFRDA